MFLTQGTKHRMGLAHSALCLHYQLHLFLFSPKQCSCLPPSLLPFFSLSILPSHTHAFSLKHSRQIFYSALLSCVITERVLGISLIKYLLFSVGFYKSYWPWPVTIAYLTLLRTNYCIIVFVRIYDT